MSNNFHKRAIATQFNKAAANYNENAHLQNEVGKKLITQLASVDFNSENILDLGCGTGYLSKILKLSYPQANYFAIDFADKMLALSPTTKWRILSDFDTLPVVAEYIDLIFSNMSLQWSLQAMNTLAEWHRVLKTHGVLAFSTLGANSFLEMRQSCHTLPRQIGTNNFLSQTKLKEILNNLKFSEIYFHAEIITLTFPDIFSLLKHFKKIGANYVFNRSYKTIATRQSFLLLEKNYKQFLNAKQNLPLSYEVLYCLARK